MFVNGMYPGKSLKKDYGVLENPGNWSLQVLEKSILMSVRTLVQTVGHLLIPCTRIVRLMFVYDVQRCTLHMVKHCSWQWLCVLFSCTHYILDHITNSHEFKCLVLYIEQ